MKKRKFRCSVWPARIGGHFRHLPHNRWWGRVTGGWLGCVVVDERMQLSITSCSLEPQRKSMVGVLVLEGDGRGARHGWGSRRGGDVWGCWWIRVLLRHCTRIFPFKKMCWSLDSTANPHTCRTTNTRGRPWTLADGARRPQEPGRGARRAPWRCWWGGGGRVID